MLLNERLQQRKLLRKITNREIAELSGVPESSIARILSGETQNPSYANVRDIVVALGGDEDAFFNGAPAAPAPVHTLDATAISLYEKRLEEKDQRIADKDAALADKNRWIRNLFIVTSILVCFLVAWLIIDITNPSIGWFRY